jgi:type IV secretion system protein VirB3
MLGGVTYGFAVANAVLTTELFLVTHSAWALGAAGVAHLIGYVACLNEPRIFDLWLTRVRLCPRVPNFRHWGCNCYRP